MFAITRIVRPALIAWVALMTCTAPAASSPAVVPAAQTWQLLDYIAVDYANAVRDGDYTFKMPQKIPSYLVAIAAGDLVFKPISARSGVWAEPPMVDKATAISEENGYAEPIVVDNITTEDAATELTNLAEQGVDVILVGASEIADPLTDLVAQYPDIFWYCNCGVGYPETPGLAQSQDDSSEISYSAGYATGLLLQASGGDSVAFIGCCDLNFEKEAYLAYEMGLTAVDPAYPTTYIPSGAFPFDFDNKKQ